MKQRTVLLSGAAVILVSVIVDLGNFLDTLTYKNETLVSSLILNIFILAILIFLFTLITFKSSSSFAFWWRFARYAVPVSLVLIGAINFGVLHTSSYGTYGLGDMLNQTYDLWALTLIYVTFTIGSLVQIVRGYRVGQV